MPLIDVTLPEGAADIPFSRQITVVHFDERTAGPAVPA